MATWNERIDNLQARLANLVSEEFAGANFYNTNIAVSDYNPSIDSTVTVTITVTNAEGDPVEDASVPVTASEGQFTKLNNTTITAASSVTGTTNSSGQFTLTYACSEWGLITFSANNRSTQVHVTGWREITTGTGWLWVNDETKTAVYYFSHTGSITSEISYSNAIPSGYRPLGYVRMKLHNSQSILVFLNIETNGTVRITGTSQNSITASCQITYAYGVQ